MHAYGVKTKQEIMNLGYFSSCDLLIGWDVIRLFFI